jgi:hypothetical protein
MSKGIEENLKSGKLGSFSGVLYTRGKLWGWAERLAVLQGGFLNFYSRAEDYVVSARLDCLDMSLIFNNTGFFYPRLFARFCLF